jgi:hypothetical protein
VPKNKIEELDNLFTECKQEYREQSSELARQIFSLKRDFQRKYPDYYQEINIQTNNRLFPSTTLHGGFSSFNYRTRKPLSCLLHCIRGKQENFKRMAQEMNDLAINAIGNSILKRIEKLKTQCDDEKINQATINSIEGLLTKWDQIWQDNVDHKKLQSIIKQLKTTMKGVNAERIRSNEHLRDKVSKKMDSISGGLKVIANHKAKRKLDV